ncbi:MAG TPA: hypothetical protein VFV05_20930 [Methylomirabilota bacterium]|nr:hypothetical protein [Methylomirabilota bacterium]
MRTRAQLVNTPRLHIPLARLALCVDCEVCFEIGPDQCPACGSRTWSALSRFIGDASEKAVVRAVHALVEEARGLSEMPGGQHHLLIVSQEQPKLFQTLKHELRDNRSITVILDRRGRGPTPSRIPNQRWRHVDHQLKALGWAIVRSETPAGRAAERPRSAVR